MASIEKRKSSDGSLSYHITVCSGYGANGKKNRRRMVFQAPRELSEKQADKEAQKEAFRFEQQLEQGYVADDQQKFRDYADYVLELKLRNGIKRSTYERYKTLLPKINAAVGNMRLKDIRPMHLNLLYAELGKPGMRENAQRSVPIQDIGALLKERHIKKCQLGEQANISPQTISAVVKGTPVLRQNGESIAKTLGIPYSKLFRTETMQTPLSSKTVLEYHRLTCAILSQAEKEMLIPYNAAKKASPPKQTQKEINYFQPAQICEMLDALQTEPLRWQVLVQLLMITGMRRGEIAGLKWEKIDFERCRVKVDASILCSPEIGIYESTTKTGNRRYIPLPEETLSLLKRYRQAQRELQIINGDRWVQTDFVFTRDDGSPIRPDAITQWLSSFSKRRGLPHINPHAFRHTAASVLIAQGTDVVTVSKMLGHSKVSTTEDIYSHVIEDSKQQASNMLADVYFHGKKARIG